MANQALSRLTILRKARGLTMAALAAEVGTDASQINKLEKSRRRMSDHWAARLAPVLGIKPAELFEGADARRAPLIGYVGAGEVVHGLETEPDRAPIDGDKLEAPPGFDQVAAVTVRGDSMLPAYRDGDTLFIERAKVPVAELHNHDCVVCCVDGRMFVKRLQRGTSRNHFHLMSYNPSTPPMLDEKLEWAAPIKWIKRG